MAEYQSSPTR